MSLAAVPAGIDPTAVRGYLGGLPGVAGVHDLHIWAMSTTETALTAHLVMPAGHPGDAFLIEAAALSTTSGSATPRCRSRAPPPPVARLSRSCV